MAEENQEVEQITGNPKAPAKSKEKDPKKVAAGKKLAEYNRKAKEALAREMKRESEEGLGNRVRDNDGGTDESRAWIPELSFTTVLSAIGIGLTALDLYARFYKKKEGEPITKTNGEQSTQPSKIPVAATPKMGML